MVDQKQIMKGMRKVTDGISDLLEATEGNPQLMVPLMGSLIASFAKNAQRPGTCKDEIINRICRTAKHVP